MKFKRLKNKFPKKCGFYWVLYKMNHEFMLTVARIEPGDNKTKEISMIGLEDMLKPKDIYCWGKRIKMPLRIKTKKTLIIEGFKNR